MPEAPRTDYRFLEDAALYYYRFAGPATRDDFLWWGSLSRSAARHTIEDLAVVLEEVDLQDERSAQFMLEEDAAELREDRFVETSRVALLPPVDPVQFATRRGFGALCEPRVAARILGQGRPGLRDSTAAVRPLLVGGSVLGTWLWNARDGQVEFHLAREVEDETTDEVRRAAASLAEFLSGPVAKLPRGEAPSRPSRAGNYRGPPP